MTPQSLSLQTGAGFGLLSSAIPFAVQEEHLCGQGKVFHQRQKRLAESREEEPETQSSRPGSCQRLLLLLQHCTDGCSWTSHRYSHTPVRKKPLFSTVSHQISLGPASTWLTAHSHAYGPVQS